MRLSIDSLIAIGLVSVLFAACGSDPVVQQEAEWPGFRGPESDGFYADASSPRRWAEDSPNVLWKTRIPGGGNSSPIVANGRVYVTTSYGEASDDAVKARGRFAPHRVVMALDLATGEVLWETPLYSDQKGDIHWLNTHAVSTPATDGNLIFASFDSRLAALDPDGKILWQKNLDPDYVAHSRYGGSASVALSGDAVILVRDREDSERENPGFLVAVAKKTGEEIWRHEWLDTCCSYTTPLVVERGGREEVLHSASRRIVSYDAATGTRLWSAEHAAIQPVPSLLLAGDLLVSPGAVHSKMLTVFRLAGLGADTQAELLWQSRTEVPDIPSPILHQGTLYTVTQRGVIRAYEAETGNKLWRKRLPTGNYLGSPVATAEHMYLPATEGVTAVVSLQTPNFRLLAENQLPEGSSASPALTSTCLLLRTASQLYCIGDRRTMREKRRAKTVPEAPATID